MPKEKQELHEHPESGLCVYGRRLQEGDTIKATDLYSSSNGRWEPAPCSGLTLQGDNGVI